MHINTKVTVVLAGLVVSGCIGAVEDGDIEVSSTESAITFPIPPPPPWPPLQLCPSQHPQILETPYVGDTKSDAIIVHDADVFWANMVVRTDQQERDWIRNAFASNSVPVWDIGRRAAAFAQMYDLLLPIDTCRAGFYLERLRVMADELLNNRDDRRTVSPIRPVDYFRGKVMAAWGSAEPTFDAHWNTDVTTAGLFTYPMAAFARRVAERWTDFGASSTYAQDAIRFTTAVLETYQSFRSDLTQADGNWAYYRFPSTYASLQCNFPNQTQCPGYRANAGYPLAWNANLSFMKSLAEAAIVADGALYQSSPDSQAKTQTIYYGTFEAPMVIARNVRFFMDNLHLGTGLGSDGAYYYTWNHEYHSPFSTQTQNTAFGQFELASLQVIQEDKVYLDGMLQDSGSGLYFAFDPNTRLRIATTFLRLTWNYDYGSSNPQNILAENVNGTGNKSAANNANEECAGFVPLAQVDPWVWVRCRDATFQFRSSQNYPLDLRVDNYAALLRYR